jgi:hypothetical protein
MMKTVIRSRTCGWWIESSEIARWARAGERERRMANQSGSNIRKMGGMQEANGSCTQVRPEKAHGLDARVGDRYVRGYGNNK